MAEVLLEAVGLQKSFTKGAQTLTVLRGVDVRVYRGEMLGIVGASGAGKSTLLHLMGTLDRPTGGRLEFAGKDVFTLSDAELARFRSAHVGFVFQFQYLLPEFTALENTLLPAKIARVPLEEAERRARNLLADLGLADRLEHRPGELSGGEQQRVAIARALMNSPDLLLADEPTGNLDSAAGLAIYELMRHLNRETAQTFVIVTHNGELARGLDRIVRLADGHISEAS